MKIKIYFKAFIITTAFLLSFSNINAAPIIVDHTCTDLSKIPIQYIDAAKQNFKIWYGHTSHGSQITSGMEVFNSPPYNFTSSVQPGALSYQETYGDLGHYGDTTWADQTRTQLNLPTNDRNFIMWSWCGGVSDNTEQGINTYLSEMTKLENQYPGVIFIYMTGHLDGTGLEGNLNIRNNQIRDYCKNNNKILFDFADIESYDPNGKYVLPLYADDGCYYYENNETKNWAEEWCEANPGKCSSCECAHSHSLNCDLKARAFWWMLARIAGWDGTTGTITPTPTPTPIKTSTATPTPIITATPTISPTPQITSTPTPSPTPSTTPIASFTPTPTISPIPTITPISKEPSLSQILSACKYLKDGDIPIDTFTPPPNALYVASSGGNDTNPGTIDKPFATLDRAVITANENAQTSFTIYLRNGIHLYKGTNDAEYLSIDRGNLYITSYPGEQATIRPYIYPANPTNSGNERAFEIAGSYQNITFDNLIFEGWSVICSLGSHIDTPPLRNIVFKNITAREFKHRDGDPNFISEFLETIYIDSDVYGEGKQIFDNPDTAHYQIEGLIISNVNVSGVDLAINVGDENDANVKGMRVSHLNLINPVLPPGGSANDAIAIVNSYKILIDHCSIKNINDDGIDTKSFDVSVVNCYVEGTGRNAVKFWRNGEMINTILYDVTKIDDGAIISEEGPLRIINCVLLKHEYGYAGTFAYDIPSTKSLEIVNSAFGEVKGFYVNTKDFSALNNRYFDILEDSAIYSGQINAQDATELNTILNCSGNAMSTNQFKNPATGDFSLKAGSEWIDAGTSNGVLLPTFDFFGNPRISGKNPDIGAIEVISEKKSRSILLY